MFKLVLHFSLAMFTTGDKISCDGVFFNYLSFIYDVLSSACLRGFGETAGTLFDSSVWECWHDRIQGGGI